jgi:nitrite reductase/ring-hydroxylating ferredoxin subunit
MSEPRDPVDGNRDDALPSVDEIAGLDAYLDALVAERSPGARQLTPQETADRVLAAQLRLSRDGAETPSPAFLAKLESAVAGAVTARPARRRPRLTRGGFLRSAATLAGGIGLGVAGAEGVAAAQDAQRPHDLIVRGNERWYDIAAVGEVAPGGLRSFSAGGLLGFLLNDDGRLHAVSAICTHMGCRLKPTPAGGAATEMHCLCHASRFDRRGTVIHGVAPSSLPTIAIRVENGRVYALGTRETV